MSNIHFTTIGSGTVDHIQTSPAYNITPGTFPVPGSRHQLKTRQGEGAVILNPEDFSISINLRSQAITVTTAATPLPASPLEFRRALVVHNNGASTVYLGNASVTTADGFPLLSGEKISFDVGATPGATVYAIAGGSINVRIMELS